MSERICSVHGFTGLLGTRPGLYKAQPEPNTLPADPADFPRLGGASNNLRPPPALPAAQPPPGRTPAAPARTVRHSQDTEPRHSATRAPARCPDGSPDVGASRLAGCDRMTGEQLPAQRRRRVGAFAERPATQPRFGFWFGGGGGGSTHSSRGVQDVSAAHLTRSVRFGLVRSGVRAYRDSSAAHGRPVPETAGEARCRCRSPSVPSPASHANVPRSGGQRTVLGIRRADQCARCAAPSRRPAGGARGARRPLSLNDGRP